MIIKLTSSPVVKQTISEAKVVMMHAPSVQIPSHLKSTCSQLYSNKASLCTVLSTKLKVIYRNYN
ncbi:MAG TPA: hypothetical protein VNI52_01425 [Sphingobacteriaceae bacterium]|nr:hypothetical protein [Sphingobacteriaceae bacterium]